MRREEWLDLWDRLPGSIGGNCRSKSVCYVYYVNGHIKKLCTFVYQSQDVADSPCAMPAATPWGGVRGDFGVLSPEAVRGERGGDTSDPTGRDVLLLLRSSLPSWGMGEEPGSTVTRSARVNSRVQVTMSVFSSNGRGNLPSAQLEKREGGERGRERGGRGGGERGEREGRG